MKDLAKIARKKLRRRQEPASAGAMRYVLIGLAVLSVAALVRMAPELRRYMKMRAM